MEVKMTEESVIMERKQRLEDAQGLLGVIMHVHGACIFLASCFNYTFKCSIWPSTKTFFRQN